MTAESSHSQDSAPGRLDFQGLVDQHYAALYRFAVSLTHGENNAADLVQATFLAWAEKGHQLKDLSKVKSWLYTTLHRRFLESERRRVRFPHLELDSAAPELPGVEPEAMNHLGGQEALELLSRLDPPFKAAVALFYLEDYSYAEIADILDVPLGTVKSRIGRGLAQLKVLASAAAPGARPGTGGAL